MSAALLLRLITDHENKIDLKLDRNKLEFIRIKPQVLISYLC